MAKVQQNMMLYVIIALIIGGVIGYVIGSGTSGPRLLSSSAGKAYWWHGNAYECTCTKFGCTTTVAGIPNCCSAVCTKVTSGT